MKVKDSDLDKVIYIIVCIATGGLFWISRILISMAIRKALENKNT